MKSEGRLQDTRYWSPEVGLLGFVLFSAGLIAGEQNRSGILMDTLCGETSAHNSEKVAHHTVACSLMKSCKASGFGMVSEQTFLKFDDGGDKLALERLEETSLKRKLRVRVWGDFDFERGTVRVSRLEPVP